MGISSVKSGENPRTRFESKEVDEITKGKKDIFSRFGLSLNAKMAGIVKDSIVNQQFSGSDGSGGFSGASGGCGGGIHRKPSR
ncbi:MAG: hypothetical protein K1060chlam4_01045 [Candidatus Anoxychlamydiales bacterium]|nr:hypothetical protein [Candidatus Anoxychlamydiales bacterium]